MHRLKQLRDAFICAVESQLGNLANVDAKELGEVVDMVKDMEEAIYYCSISKAMEEQEEEKKHAEKEGKYYPMPMYYPMGKRLPDYYRDIDRNIGRMYYEDRDRDYDKEELRKSGMMIEHKDNYPMEIRDVREGRSPISRKNYMESKEMHHGTPAQIKELEKYLHELSQDITEMIQDASQEEKAILQQKLSTLASKIK